MKYLILGIIARGIGSFVYYFRKTRHLRDNRNYAEPNSEAVKKGNKLMLKGIHVMYLTGIEHYSIPLPEKITIGVQRYMKHNGFRASLILHNPKKGVYLYGITFVGL